MTDVDDIVTSHHFSPVDRELDEVHRLEVEGAVPPVLDGLYLRNGPNPHSSAAKTSTWWSGDGMVHAVELCHGAPVSYRNRWVRTRRLSERAGLRAPRGPTDPIPGPANAGVLWHGGRLLALDGTGFPYRLNTELGTVRVEDYDGTQASPMCVRPRIDPETGGMTAYGVDPYGPPYLRYQEHDAFGDIVHQSEVSAELATWQPDFGVTATRVLFFQTPARNDDRLLAEQPGLPYRLDPTLGTRVTVVQRGTDGENARWIDTDPVLAVMVVNAFDNGGSITADVLCADHLPLGPPETVGARWERWEVSPTTVTRTLVDERPTSLVRIDPLVEGRPWRYAYGIEPSPLGSSVLLRYDRARDETVRWEAGAGRLLGEPVFVRDPEGHADDEGWLLVLSYNAERDKSDLLVLDASSMRAQPEAVVHLPARVPGGLHAAWVPGDRYR